jgi:Mrp family chromosome partitioning ATPase
MMLFLVVEGRIASTVVYQNFAVLSGVGETIVVLSGKGGVGKSTTTVQLAFTLRALGYKVGILDVDLCGPSIPRMLGVEDQDVLTTPNGSVEQNQPTTHTGIILIVPACLVI